MQLKDKLSKTNQPRLNETRSLIKALTVQAMTVNGGYFRGIVFRIHHKLEYETQRVLKT